MKIVLKKSGETINVPLRVAERYMRLGLATLYVAPKYIPDVKPKKTRKKKEEEIEIAESDFKEADELQERDFIS